MTNSKNYIITAANEKYFKNLQLLIFSFKLNKEYNNSTLLIYDLGLSLEQSQALKRLEIQYEKRIIYRHFSYDDYPVFVRPEYNTYSWKPIIIYLANLEHRGNFLWMDSANIILKELDPVWETIGTKHTYAPISGSGTLREWTVQETLDYLNVPPHFYSKRNRAGNTFGFSNRSEIIRDLLFRWKELSLIKECIRPEGANRTNHRDDQSLLTILLLEQEEKGTIELTSDEVNISSGSPSPYISVRNIFPRSIKLKAGYLAYCYFRLQRFVDRLVNRVKGN